MRSSIVLYNILYIAYTPHPILTIQGFEQQARTGAVFGLLIMLYTVGLSHNSNSVQSTHGYIRLNHTCEIDGWTILCTCSFGDKNDAIVGLRMCDAIA